MTRAAFAEAVCDAVSDPPCSWDAEARSFAGGRLWPLGEQGRHLGFPDILNSLVADAVDPVRTGAVGIHHAGMWECNLADQSLIWSGGVYDIFGLDRWNVVTRMQALSSYREHSRAALERLRDHAIRKGLGFTLDVEIRAAAVGEVRHVRIIGAPLFEDGVPARLHGVKLLI